MFRPSSPTARLVLTALAIAVLCACQPGIDPTGEPPSPAPAAEGSARTDGPAEASDEDADRPSSPDVFLRQGPLHVTVAEFERALRWRAWIGGESIEEALGADWIDNDTAVATVARPLLAEALVRHDAERLGVNVTDAHREAARAAHPIAAELDDLPPAEREAALDAHGLTEADLAAVVEDLALYQALLAFRLDAVTDDDRWDAYARRNSTVALRVVNVPNIFSRDEVEHAVRTRAADIDAEYAAGGSRFIAPARARARVIRATTARRTPEEARALVEDLRTRALADGTLSVVSESEDASSMTGDGRRWISRDELPEAFDIPIGEISPIIEDARGFYFVEVFERQGGEMRPLDDTLRQRIARQLLAAERMAPDALAIAERVAERMREGGDLMPLLEAHVLREETVPPFVSSSANVIPNVGYAPALVEAVFADGVETGDVIGPVHTPSGIVVAEVTAREQATREAFERDRDAFEVEYEAYLREHMWPARVQSFGAEHEVQLNLERLREQWPAPSP